MNTVKTARNTPERIKVTSLIGYGTKHTAFMGKVESGPHGLYLICYLGVILAGDPTRTWTGGTAIVDRFCDIYIEEIVT